MKGLAQLLGVLLISIVMVYWTGCAGSKPKPTPAAQQEAVEPDNSGQPDDIEKLLGLDESGGNQATPNEDQQAAGGEQEDDLLKILKKEQAQASNDQPANAESAPAASPAAAQPEVKRLKRQIENLNRQIQQQKQTISQLKAQLLAKEEEIQQLKQRSSNSGFASSGFSGNYEAEYERARELFQNRNYREAIQIFEQLVNQNPNHPLADNAQYWIGESYFMLGQYRKAILAFEKVFLFEQSNKNDYAQYKLGLSYYMLGDKQRARSEFQKLIDQYPRSPLVSKARQYLQKIS